MKHHAFAPGTIEVSARRNLVEGLSRVVLVLVCLAAIAAVLGFATGYFGLASWPH